MFKYYKLEGKMAVTCNSLMEWVEWFETASRKVVHDEINEIMISTVFLGLDHNFSRRGDPLLFVTLVFFPNGETGRMRRYFTWGEAEQGHKQITDLIRIEAIGAEYDAAEVMGNLMLKMSYGR